MAQYDKFSKNYTDFAKIDPTKVYAQYPEAIRILGDIKNKRVLDVGCGSGLLTTQLAKKGAKVIGYDVSKEQIELAKAEEHKNSFGIQYFVSGPEDIEKKLIKSFGNNLELFDKASSTLVLHYAKDRKHLTKFFSSTFRLLKHKGIFCAIFTNPDFQSMNKASYNRLFARENGKMRVDFLDSNGKVKVSAYFSDLSRKDYEFAAKKAGFESFKWIKLKVNKEGIKKMGSDFWKDYEKDCPYIGFVTVKK